MGYVSLMKDLTREKKVVAIVEARMTSTRLPGKHLLEADGVPMLGHLIARLKSTGNIERVVVAMTNNKEDDILESSAKNLGAEVFRGSEYDVMKRVLDAAQSVGANIICEVTGDCPIVDVNLVDQAIETFLANESVEYLNNGRLGLPDGMGVQVFTTEILSKSEKMTRDPLDREHVTLHIRKNPQIFSAMYLAPPSNLKRPNISVTLDEKSDYHLLKKIVEYFGPTKPLFSCLEVIHLLEKNPEWLEINKHVARKGDA